MRSNRAATRRMSPARMFLTMLVFLVIGGGGTVAALWAMGVVDLPLFRRQVSHEGMVPVPMSGQLIPAYTKVTRDQLANLQTHGLNVLWMPKQNVSPEMIVELGKIIGRVVDHDKPAGYAFTEKDFLPVGTRAGLVAGIPAGKRSLTLDASKLSGVFGLKAGDHMDLLASVPIDMSKAAGGRGGAVSNMLTAQAQIATMQKRASVRPLAEDAVVVQAVTIRQKPISSSSLMQGTSSRTIPVQEVVIAVDPAEVAPITEAIATQVEIMCVARSGLPNDPGAARMTPGSDPLSQVKMIDTISGKKREVLVFSGTGYPERVDLTAAEPSTPTTQKSPEQDQESRHSPLHGAK